MREMVYETKKEVVEAVEERLESTHPKLLDGFEPRYIANQIINEVGLPVEEGLIDRKVNNG